MGSYYNPENVFIMSTLSYLLINSQGLVGAESEVGCTPAGKRKTCYDKQNFLPLNLHLYPCDTDSLIRQNTQVM